MLERYNLSKGFRFEGRERREICNFNLVSDKLPEFSEFKLPGTVGDGFPSPQMLLPSDRKLCTCFGCS